MYKRVAIEFSWNCLKLLLLIDAYTLSIASRTQTMSVPFPSNNSNFAINIDIKKQYDIVIMQFWGQACGTQSAYCP